MKNKILLTLLSVALIGLTGCETTSFERGVIAGEAAKAIFDAPQDEAKFQAIKADIVAYLATDKPITRVLVDQYLAKVASDFSPAFLLIVQSRIEAELPDVEIIGIGGLDDSRIREFLTGVAATL